MGILSDFVAVPCDRAGSIPVTPTRGVQAGTLICFRKRLNPAAVVDEKTWSDLEFPRSSRPSIPPFTVSTEASFLTIRGYS